jgi:hypothetical protein
MKRRGGRLRSRLRNAIGDAKILASRIPVVRSLGGRPARILARCLDNWRDFDDALAYLTPGGQGIWNDVAFVRETIQPADWHVVFNHPGRKSVKLRTSPNRVLFAVGEPPVIEYRNFHLGQGENTVVLTQDPDMATVGQATRRYILTPSLTRTWSVKKTYDDLHRNQVKDKIRRLSWVTSNLASLEGHRYRLNFLERLRKNTQFDLFGRGFNPIADKWDGLAPYRYSIAFENTRAPLYFTEKLMDCFVAETMPIYFGCPEIAEYFPAESMIILDPEDPDAVAKINDAIQSDLWLRRRDAIMESKRLTLDKYNLFARLADFMETCQEPPLPARTVELRRIRPDAFS